MKNPKLKIKKKAIKKGINKLKKEIDEIVYDALLDIKYYIVNDIMSLLKKRDIIYATQNKKKDKKKEKKR